MQKLKESKVQSRLQKVIGGIYQIINSKNGKYYVGSSKSIYNRIYNHKTNLRLGKHGNTHLQHAWDKYGEESFYYKILEICEDCSKEFLEEREDYWINYYESDKDEKGYNKQKARQGSFSEKWRLGELKRQVEKQSKKDYNYYNSKIYFKDIPQEDKHLIIQNILKYTETHFIAVIRNKTSSRLAIKLTNTQTFEERFVYILLNPLRLVSKQEFEQSKKESGGSIIYRIEPGTSNIVESFYQLKDVLIKYPQIKRKQLERLLYIKKNFSSVQGMIFVLEQDYSKDKVYTIRNKKIKEVKEPKSREFTVILKLNEQGQPIKEFIGLKSIVQEYPEITLNGLQKVLYEGRKSTKGYYFILKRKFQQ